MPGAVRRTFSELGPSRRSPRHAEAASSPHIFFIAAPLLIAAIDVAVVIFWQRLEAWLGPLFRLELGLLLFLNLLAALLALEVFDAGRRTPRLLRWYFALPLGFQPRRESRRRRPFLAILGACAALTGLFFGLENFVLPFVVDPAWAGTSQLGVVVAIVLWRVAPRRVVPHLRTRHRRDPRRCPRAGGVSRGRRPL